MKKENQYEREIKGLVEYCLRKDEKTFKLRPIREIGSYSYTQYSADHTNDYTKVLDAYKLKYEIGNDAPRGGKLGKYIEVKVDKRNALTRQISSEMEVK